MSSEELNKQLEEYLKSLNEKEKQAYEIAKSHLGTTFSLWRSNGFQEYKKQTQTTPQN